MESSSRAPITEEAMAKRLWNKSKYEQMHALYTPFMVCLAAGTLKIESFLNYIAQDVYILRAIAEAYKMAEDYTDNDDAKVEIRKLLNKVPEKLKLQCSFLQMMSIDTTPNATTIKYTKFLRATAYGEVEGIKATPFKKKLAAYIFGSLTPRMSLYAFLGKELKALLDPRNGNHPNQKWIDNISSDNFQEEAMQTEELLGKLTVSLSREELDIIEKLYRQAMKLEVEFFLAPPILQKIVVPMCKGENTAGIRLLLFSAFDLTCAVLGSSVILSELAISSAPKSDQPQSENMWDELSKEYTEKYEKFMKSVLVDYKAEKFDHVGLSTAIQLISAIEKEASLRVASSGVLKGLSVEDIKRAGECIVLQDGCIGFFHSAMKNENLTTNINVMSSCWSGELIKSAFSSGGLDCVNIHANELIYESSISTGEIMWNVQSPLDRVHAFNGITLRNCSIDQNTMTVYIGNTVDDLACLTLADVGIVIGSNSNLRGLGSVLGVTFIPLFRYVIQEQKRIFLEKHTDLEGRKLLYTVSSWAEIHAFMLGFS